MARTKDPAVRSLLIERAAQMLRAREPITLRSLVGGTGVSTMAVYTYFDGIDGLWKAVRQEGFTRLTGVLAQLGPTDDAVRDLAALGAAYVANAEANPDLYRVMFDASVELEDPAGADAGLQPLVEAVARATADGRFTPGTESLAVATQAWVIGHGLASLVINGPLPREALGYAVPMLTALFTQAGDEPDRCRASVSTGWG
ncbi:TetR/AcrR family transcriptional regulator [Kribbella italica]|uniref:AcrR family transcriptional regulator n=1 Tax=Kribbella italica TaxID=1540520 RepID=A0A7W9J392_9ACTN|nr:TetR/AcrR family transcriptional regulator [Kribbella italica]MBB5834325.1 AcrR family transcriptional regulator [Kribbella italica]